MKTMNSFAAQQLTKNQMNQVSGGIGLWHCKWEGGENYFTHAEAAKFIKDWRNNNPESTPHCQHSNY